jgi:voltage-gated potassium channel
VRWSVGDHAARIGARDPSQGRRAKAALGILIALTLLGTLGFMLVEQLGFLDALYMAVITLSTVGYQEVAPISEAGRIYTIAFIFVGVGTGLYAVVNIAEYLIEGRLREALGRRSMDRTIQTLEGHVIVCGFGRLGKVVVEELEQAGTSVVVIDSDPTLESDLEAAGRLHVVGSALEDSVLRQAGIERAATLVVAMPSDPDNVFVALSARELNPEIAVHARAESAPGVRRLHLAGAGQVISIHRLGGQRIANAIVRPAVVDFIELASPGGGAPIDLEEVVLSEGCAIDQVPLRDLPQRGVRVAVVAIKRGGQPTTLIPRGDDVLQAGDHVVVVGDRENVRNLALLAERA